ncbi:Tol-Pal system beta propeller repeat protein TolB [bacterium]|nr:Tol-Pal system beta propeller repeat protein TolB [bacterium]
MMKNGWTSSGLHALLAPLLLFLLVGGANAQVHLSVSKEFGQKVIVAIPLFDVEGGTMVDAAVVREVLEFDLGHSGYFSLVENMEFVDETEADDRVSGRIDFQEWSALGAEILVKGKVGGTLAEVFVEAMIYDLAQGKAIFGRRYVVPRDEWRAAVHSISDDIVFKLTGEIGIAKTRIAFVSGVTGSKEVYVMDYDGENRRRVTRQNAIAIYPDWFPGAREIAYTVIIGSRQECRRTTVAGSGTRLTAFPGLNAFASPSPSGDDMLMTLSKDGNPEIYRLRADGSDPKRLTSGRSTESSPCWSPDERRVAFVSDRAGAPQIYVMSASGGTPRRVTLHGNYNTSPDWSPKGDLIVYTSRISGVYQICTVDVKSGEVTRLTTGSGQKEDPSWARDGRHVVYSMKQGSKADLYMIDMYELEPVRLTSGAGDYLSPAWSD